MTDIHQTHRDHHFTMCVSRSLHRTPHTHAAPYVNFTSIQLDENKNKLREKKARRKCSEKKEIIKHFCLLL